jgi:hypothetical protein
MRVSARATENLLVVGLRAFGDFKWVCGIRKTGRRVQDGERRARKHVIEHKTGTRCTVRLRSYHDSGGYTTTHQRRSKESLNSSKPDEPHQLPCGGRAWGDCDLIPGRYNARMGVLAHTPVTPDDHAGVMAALHSRLV